MDDLIKRDSCIDDYNPMPGLKQKHRVADTTECPECAKHVDVHSKFCGRCDREIPCQESTRSNWS